MTEYKCLTCVHLQPGHDLMECELKVVRYINENRSSWTFDPTCMHDANIQSRRLLVFDPTHEATYKNFPDRYVAK